MEEQEATRERQEHLPSSAKDAAPARTTAGHQLKATFDILPHCPRGARVSAKDGGRSEQP